jgi:hypothetical protein
VENIGRRKNNKGIKGKVGPKPKPPAEKKTNITVYIKQGDVDTLGGKEKVRGIAIDAIEGKLTEE